MSEAVKERWSSRKLAVAIGASLLCTVLFIAGPLSESGWLEVFKWTIVAYLTSQGLVDGAGKVAEKLRGAS